jgi:hypothetical protein
VPPIPRVRSFLDPMMRPAVRFLCAALLLCGASANKTVTWLDKRAKLIGDVYGQGVSPNRSGSWFGCMLLPSCLARPRWVRASIARVHARRRRGAAVVQQCQFLTTRVPWRSRPDRMACSRRSPRPIKCSPIRQTPDCKDWCGTSLIPSLASRSHRPSSTRP